MIKYQSQIEFIATDKKRINEFHIKTVMFPFLSMFQNFQKITKWPKQFPVITGGFATSFFK